MPVYRAIGKRGWKRSSAVRVELADGRPNIHLAPQRSRVHRTLISGFCLAAASAMGVVRAEGPTPTFAREVAPVLWQHCGPCHHPDGVGKFSVLSYSDVYPHAGEIDKAIRSGAMPPWLPAPGHGEFVGERHLSNAERQLIVEWVRAGAPSGPVDTLPAPPKFPVGWQLGTPDLIVSLPESYWLEGTGDDVYRNFVIPLPPGINRFVKAMEFLPNSPAIHHARFLLDSSGEARRLDDADPACGFGGTMPPGTLPEGQFGGWVPGRQPGWLPPGEGWRLDSPADLVVQLHLQRDGRRQEIHPQIGFYLTQNPPTSVPIRVGLVAQSIELAPKTSNQVVSRSWVLPAEARLLSVLPHAHTLAREVEFIATPLNGPPRSLLFINRWQFQWQDEYRYREPQLLPAGTRLEFRITYDNPTKRTVQHGPNSSDEMAELWFQLRPSRETDAAVIQQASRQFHAEETVLAFTARLRAAPNNAGLHLELGKALAVLGREPEAFDHLVEAAELNPSLVEAHHQIGLSYLRRELWTAARDAFKEALALNPRYQRSWVGLGMAADGAHRPEEAMGYFRQALALNPADPVAQERLSRLQAAKP